MKKTIFSLIILITFFLNKEIVAQTIPKQDSLKMKQYEMIVQKNLRIDSSLCRRYIDSLRYLSKLHNAVAFNIKSYALEGFLAFFMAEYDKSLRIFEENYERAKFIEESTLPKKWNTMAQSLDMRRHIYLTKKLNRDQSLILSKELLKLTIEKDVDEYNIRAYQALAEYWSTLGEYEIANAYYLMALEEAKKKKSYEAQAICLLYNNIAEIEIKQGKYNSALNTLELALESTNSVHATLKNTKVYYTLRKYGTVYKNLKKYSKARSYYQKANKILQKEGDQNAESKIVFHLDIADTYFEEKEYLVAKQHYESAFRIVQRVNEQKHKAITLLKIGNTLIELGELDKGMLYQQKALSVVTLGQVDSTNIYQLPVYKQLSRVDYSIEIMKDKAQAYKKIYATSQNKRYLEFSLKVYERLIEIVNAYLLNISSNESKYFFLNDAYKIYNSAIEVATQLYNLTEQDEYLERAIYFSEKAKGNLIYTSLKEADGYLSYNIPNRLSSKVISIQNKLTTLKSQHDSSNTKTILVLNQKLLDTKEEIKENFPFYESYLLDKLTLDYEKLGISNITSNNCAIEYFYGDSTIYIFAITSTTKKVITLPKDSILVQHIESFINLVQTYDEGQERIQEFTEIAKYLYDQLLAPVADLLNGKELIIIPDGLLHYVPFEALVTAKSDTIASYIRLPYLVQSNPISYAYSLTILETMKDKEKSTIHKIAGFAPSFHSKSEDVENIDFLAGLNYRSAREELDALPMAQEEVSFLQKSFGADIYVKNKATESVFKEVANQYGLLHFATHTLLDDKYPQKSGLLFSNEEDTIEDGNLEMYELYGLHLNAAMVVLSACQTGYGKVERGEGVISIARAFTIAGCPSLFMSLWNITDKSTSSLMQKFYLNLKKGEAKNIALQKAKIDYIKNVDDGALAQPLFWAGMIGIGNMDAVHFASRNWLLYFGFGGLLLLLWVWWRKRKVANQVV